MHIEFLIEDIGNKKAVQASNLASVNSGIIWCSSGD